MLIFKLPLCCRLNMVPNRISPLYYDKSMTFKYQNITCLNGTPFALPGSLSNSLAGSNGCAHHGSLVAFPAL